MLSFVIRRILLRSGTLLPARRLLPFAVSPNRPLKWPPVQGGFATTSSGLDSVSTADVESESKPKSTGRKTRSSKKVTHKDKTKEKTAKKSKAKQKITIQPENLPPKHPGSAYSLWFSDWIRTQLKADGPLTAQNNMRQGAKIWHTVSEYDKQRYREKSEGLKTEYNRRMAEWREQVDPSVLRELNRRRAKRGLSRIRGPDTGRPMSGYLRYFQEVREDTPRPQEDYKDHFKALAGRAGSQWKAMSEAEKAKYNDLANAEIAAWREKHKAEGHAKQ